MTSELSGADQLLQMGPYKNWTSINEERLLLADQSASYCLPANSNHVYLEQTTASANPTVTNFNIELPNPACLTDGQSRLWFVYWDISAYADRDCTLTLKQPVIVNTPYYKYPAVPINGSSADLVISRLANSAGDTRTLLGLIIWCTTGNRYYVASMGDPTTFGTIIAGTGVYNQPTSAPSFSAGKWSLNVYSGQNVTLADLTTNEGGVLGPVGWFPTGNATEAGYWIASQPGTISQLRFFSSSNLSGIVTVTKNTVATALTLTAAAATSGADTTHSFTVAAGDRIQISFSATGGTPIVSVAFVFRPSAV